MQKPPIQAVIFDLDGTLVDTESLWVRVLQDFLRDAGHPLQHGDVLSIVYGRCWPDVYAETVRRFPELARYEIEEMSRLMWPRYLQLRENHQLPIPGSVQLLQRLAPQYPLCIVSGSTRKVIAEMMELIDITRHIDFYIGAEDYENGKPAPDGFLLAAQRFDLPPQACLVFEDSAAGVDAAHAAGMRCVALQRPGSPAQKISRADIVLEDLQHFRVESLC